MSLSILEVNLNNIVNNYQVACEYAGNLSVGSVVKCNAYGLGMKPVSQKLEQAGCRDFFVATFEEATNLRQTLDKQSKICLLNGVMPEMIQGCKEFNITPVCASWKQVELCHAEEVSFFLHVETGLQRLGVNPSEIQENDQLLKYCQGILSQLVFSEDKNHDVSKNQFQIMYDLKKDYSHLLVTGNNSGGLNHEKNCLLDMVRIGRLLYGTCDTRFELAHKIKPVVTWKARIMQIKKVLKGEGVGYGHTHIAEHDTTIAILGVGYGDGVPIGASMRGGAASFEGIALPFIGRIGMDLCVLDINAASNLQEGDWIEIYNHTTNTLDKMSAILSLNPRFLLTSLGKRVERIYVE